MEQKNNYITKNDLMFFQNEVFIDLKNIETSINTRMNKLTENIENISKEYNQKFNDFSNKIKDLVQLVTEINVDHDKIEVLYKNKDKIKDELTESKTRFYQYKKQIDSSLYKYDRIIIDNLEVPGLIGYNCKFNNLKNFLEFANGELGNLKLFKNQEIGELKIIKDKFDKISQKLEISNRDIIQRVDLIYTNKFESFKKEIEQQIEIIRELKTLETPPQNFDFSQIEIDIKKQLEKNQEKQEEAKNEINDIINKMKVNREIIDANYTIVNKQKEDITALKKQFDKLCEDVENLKKQYILLKDNKMNTKNNMPINKTPDVEDKGNISPKNKNNKTLSKNLFNKSIANKENNKDNDKIISKNNNKKNLNEDIKYLISKDQKREKLNSQNLAIENNDNKDEDKKHEKLLKNKKNRRASVNINIKNNTQFLINDNENKDDDIFKRKISKKLLTTYFSKTNLNLEKNNISNKYQKNILELSQCSSSSDNNQTNQINKSKNENMDNEFINEQININISKNLDINKKINKNVSKLIKLKPIEKPIKLNLKYSTEKILNQENSNRNINSINNNLQNKEKNVNFTINTFNNCKIENKNNNNLTENNNEISSGHRNLNLTDKEILEKYFKNIKDNKDKINYLSKALLIKNYKNSFNSLNSLENKEKNINNRVLEFNNSQKYSEENYFSNNESNNYVPSPFITNKNYSLYRISSNSHKKKINERNPLNGFLTSIPYKSKTKIEQEENEKIIINSKIEKINYKLKKIKSNTKIIINRLNLLEVNYKPINSQINDILMIILFIYEYIKKKNTNNKFSNDLFNNSNIKTHKTKKFKGLGYNSLLTINKGKNFLYTTNGFNLEEGGLFTTEHSKEELEIILKKIEPFLIKQFKDTI